MTLVPVNNAELKPLKKTAAASNPIQQQAQDLTALQFNPQQSAIERALGLTQQNLQTGINTQTQFAQNVDPRVGGAYDALQQALGKNLDQTKQIYGDAASTVGQGYDFASGQAKNTADTILGRLGASAENLGQAHALPGASQGITDELGLIQSFLASGKAGAVGNLQSLGANMQAIGQQGMSDAAAEGTQVRGDLQKGVLDAITKLQLGAQGDTNESLAQLVDLLASKGLSEKTLTQQLTQQQAAGEAEAQQRQFENMLAAQKFGLESQRASRDSSSKDLNDQLTQAKIAKELGLADKKDEYAQGSGVEGLKAWFNANLKNPKTGHQKKNYGYFKGGVERLITDVENQAATLKAGGTKNKNADIPGPYEMLVKMMEDNKATPAGQQGEFVFQSPVDGRMKSFPVQKILDAARTYFGKGGKATGTSGKPIK